MINYRRYLNNRIADMAIYGYTWKVFRPKVRKALKCYRKPLYEIDLSHLLVDDWFKKNRLITQFYIHQS
jgi:hypothetical protein